MPILTDSRILLPALCLTLALAAPAAASQRSEAAALADLFSHEVVVSRDGEPVVRLEQRLAVDGCDAVVTTTHYVPGTDERRMLERSRFEIERMDVVEREAAERADVAADEEAADEAPSLTPGAPQLELTARDYFVRAGDRGLSRWLDALGETRDAPDRAAEMRALQFRVAAGEFGAFARKNGYEMRSFLEGDPEPYYSMPLPAIALSLPEGAADPAAAAWVGYAAEHCAG